MRERDPAKRIQRTPATRAWTRSERDSALRFPGKQAAEAGVDRRTFTALRARPRIGPLTARNESENGGVFPAGKFGQPFSLRATQGSRGHGVFIFDQVKEPALFSGQLSLFFVVDRNDTRWQGFHSHFVHVPGVVRLDRGRVIVVHP